MKRFVSFCLVIITVLSMCIAFTGCSAKVESIKLSDTTVNLEPGKSYSLHATISPDNAADAKLTWTSTDYSIVNVVDGTLYAIADGNATIRVTSENGVTASCTVFVATPTAYSKLNDDEKKFVDAFVKSIQQFKNPGSVSVVLVDYYDDSTTTFVAEVKAMNGFGGVTSDTYKVYSSYISEGGYIYSSGSQFNVSKINAALKEYIEEQGW